MLKPFLPYLIAENQSSFILRRNIDENILLAHELIRYSKNIGKTRSSLRLIYRNPMTRLIGSSYVTCYLPWASLTP